MRAKNYEGEKFVLETTHGYYTEYGWGPASFHDDFETAKKKCDFWTSKGDSCRVVSDGEVVYETPVS